MKKLRLFLLAGLACMALTACEKDNEEETPGRVKTFGKFVMADTQLFRGEGKVVLDFDEANSKLLYEDDDYVKINGVDFQLSKSGSGSNTVWTANGTELTATKFYCAYVDGVNTGSVLTNFDEGGTYRFNLNTRLTQATNKILLGGVTDSNVLTLRPACAIIRLKANSSYSNVKIGFDDDAILWRGTMTITSGAVTLSGSDYMAGVTNSDGDGADLLSMEYNSSDRYWYVAVPVSSSVSTTLYIQWTHSGQVTRYKTSGPVTLQKGYVYDMGTSRQSPFNVYGIGNHRFCVSAGGQYVRFSAGNLQSIRVEDPLLYTRSNKWRFADHQYDMIQGGNSSISESNTTTWIDLFGWGTSGNNTDRTSGIAYEPYATSGTFGFTDVTADIAGTSADWGVGNASNIYYGTTISPVSWRTLTDAEWNYLVTKTGKCGFATINNTYKGMVLLPDDWVLPTGLSFNSSKTSYNDNEYNLTEWGTMEQAGAIFLPAAGKRAGTTPSESNTNGYYWSTSNEGSSDASHKTKAYYMNFTGSTVSTTQEDFRARGFSVRLVMNN